MNIMIFVAFNSIFWSSLFVHGFLLSFFLSNLLNKTLQVNKVILPCTKSSVNGNTFWWDRKIFVREKEKNIKQFLTVHRVMKILYFKKLKITMLFFFKWLKSEVKEKLKKSIFQYEIVKKWKWLSNLWLE